MDSFRTIEDAFKAFVEHFKRQPQQSDYTLAN